MKTLLFAAIVVLALLLGGLAWYLPHREDSARIARGDDSPAPVAAPIAARPAVFGQPPPPANAAAPPIDEPALAAKAPPPPMSEIDAIVARMKASSDDQARQMLMHEFVATAARMDFHDQLIARDRLDTIQHSYDPPAVVPPPIVIQANVDGSAP